MTSYPPSKWIDYGGALLEAPAWYSMNSAYNFVFHVGNVFGSKSIDMERADTKYSNSSSLKASDKCVPETKRPIQSTLNGENKIYTNDRTNSSPLQFTRVTMSQHGRIWRFE